VVRVRRWAYHYLELIAIYALDVEFANISAQLLVKRQYECIPHRIYKRFVA
jgi:hypothetical protein